MNEERDRQMAAFVKWAIEQEINAVSGVERQAANERIEAAFLFGPSEVEPGMPSAYPVEAMLAVERKWRHLGPDAPDGTTVTSYCGETSWVLSPRCNAIPKGRLPNHGATCPDCLRVHMSGGRR